MISKDATNLKTERRKHPPLRHLYHTGKVPSINRCFERSKSTDPKQTLGGNLVTPFDNLREIHYYALIFKQISRQVSGHAEKTICKEKQRYTQQPSWGMMRFNFLLIKRFVPNLLPRSMDLSAS